MEFKPIPEGSYQATTIQSKEKLDGKYGPYTKLTFRIMVGEHVGRKVTKLVGEKDRLCDLNESSTYLITITNKVVKGQVFANADLVFELK